MAAVEGWNRDLDGGVAQDDLHAVAWGEGLSQLLNEMTQLEVLAIDVVEAEDVARGCGVAMV